MSTDNVNKCPSSTCFTGQLLIAMPSLRDSLFTQSVTYVCEHNDNGAMGLVLTQPSDLTLGDIFLQMDLDDISNMGSVSVLTGGPVNEQRGFILHDADSQWNSSMCITETIKLTASRDIVAAIAKGVGPKEMVFALGYAGWSPGQLEKEISDNSWLTVEADHRILFETPVNERWRYACQKLGIDPHLITSEPGHA